VKPELTEVHKLRRLAFVEEQRLGDVYKYNYNTIHIDEKWFNAKKVMRRMILADGEKPPERKAKHKSHIPKCMFLCAVGRPRLAGIAGRVAETEGRPHPNSDYDDWCWDGKVGQYPVVEYRPAVRNSVHRRAGTIEPHPVSMNTERYEYFIISKLLPDIALRCPYFMKRETIYIQHDNAPPHRINLERFNAKCTELNIRCELYYQPAQSPDLNICDLSFFPSIQALYYKITGERSLENIILSVRTAWDLYKPRTLNRCWVSLLMNYNLILEHGGCNQYKLGHINKGMHERNRTLPITIPVYNRLAGVHLNDNHDQLIADFMEVADEQNENENGNEYNFDFDGEEIDEMVAMVGV
jgi:hypothetical protein